MYYNTLTNKKNTEPNSNTQLWKNKSIIPSTQVDSNHHNTESYIFLM
jgi:hypothetical protein